MPKLPIISGNQAVKCFEKIGYQVIRQRGSHVRIRHKSNSTKQPLTIPRHKALGKGLIRKLLRDAELTENSFTKAMDESRKTFLDIALSNVPESRQAQNLADRFRKHGEAYFRFITTPGIEPTNSVTEQAMRFVVIDRYITQDTRSEKGRAWCERIWTVLATCRKQDRSSWQFLQNALSAYYFQTPTPSLLPQSS